MHSSALCHRSRLLRTALPALLALLALPLFAATPAYLTIGTGALSGVYYPTGGAICRLLNEESDRHGLHCSVQSTAGSLANLAELAKGEVQLALVQSDILYHAAHGSGPFAGKAPNDQLRRLFRLHQESLTLLASATSNINSLNDIEGKRVDFGSPGSGDRITSRALLDAMGWQESSFAPPPPASAPGNRLEGLCNGTLDAAFLVAGHPNQGIGDLTARCNVRLIPIEGEQIEKLLAAHPYYQHSRIGANLYPGQPGSIATFAVTAELVALASLPEEQVRTVRDVLTDRLKQFTRLHPALTSLTLEAMQADDLIPLHPGMRDAMPSLLPPEPVPAPATTAQPAGEADVSPATQDAPRPDQRTGAAPQPERQTVRSEPASAAGSTLAPAQSGAVSAAVPTTP